MGRFNRKPYWQSFLPSHPCPVGKMKCLKTKINQALSADEFKKLYQLALDKVPSKKGKNE